MFWKENSEVSKNRKVWSKQKDAVAINVYYTGVKYILSCIGTFSNSLQLCPYKDWPKFKHFLQTWLSLFLKIPQKFRLFSGQT